MVFHQLVEEGNLARLSHARISQSNESIEVSTEDSVLFVYFSKVEVSHFDGLAWVVGITKGHCVLSEESLQPTRAESNSAFRSHVRLSSRRRLSRVVCVELFVGLFLGSEF